jgi:hypothetical protein
MRELLQVERYRNVVSGSLLLHDMKDMGGISISWSDVAVRLLLSVLRIS